MPRAAYGVLFLIVVAAAAYALYRLWRQGVSTAWGQTAAALGLHVSQEGQHRVLAGTVDGRKLEMRTAVSYEDGPAYHHTAAMVQCANPANLVAGLRRKSMLEEYKRVKTGEPAALEDAEFNRSFITVTNDAPLLEELLEPSMRATLKRWDDVEMYVRGAGLTLRRAGERRSTTELTSMARLALELAAGLEKLPVRVRSLPQQMEDAELIEGGV